MTSNASCLQEIVDEMLLDSGQSDSNELRAVLFSLGSFASLPAPGPGVELAALMTGTQDQMARRRWLRRHRSAVVGLAVIAGMGLGVTGVAATGTVHGQPARASIQHLVEDWDPSWTISGDPSGSEGDSTPAQQQVTPPPPLPAAPRTRAAGPHPEPAPPKQPPSSSTGPGTKAGGSTAQPDPVGDAVKDIVGDGDKADGVKAVGGGAVLGAAPGAALAGTAAVAEAVLSRQVQESPAREPERAVDHVARDFEKAQKLFAASKAAAARKAVRSNVDLGANWLKKFNR
ncbi:hypothetical protein QFZ40_003473 [Arthrobacter pascens]|uniref:hypothetical protein n=1 Tax=Arthrobacter pascens TaxID=1677 RepID=UPI00278B8B2A|nr:hypothetical protein [Arthrobacter pascens]MDQ0635564.1 hypothetical protein [Arthrobacter pascens]